LCGWSRNNQESLIKKIYGRRRVRSDCGGYQGLRQGHPSLEAEAEGLLGAASGVVLSGVDALGRVMPGTDYSGQFSKMTDNGFKWGDNPGDSKKIQDGWLYAQGRNY
jgi:hypothetical protein